MIVIEVYMSNVQEDSFIYYDTKKVKLRGYRYYVHAKLSVYCSFLVAMPIKATKFCEF